ncbi:hypothetical protein EJ04DRAFT_111236 [Polyplosphaeria fusca]|uniref:Uncharacterized protein n=1 Tax=Polyplosphaeria fusca TaxID=682080 RepID=A0A9P4V7I3_9PLEO|nr:hypothetical protein EJ04DRAFT_111236 [Polyplosphaeria fusca]
MLCYQFHRSSAGIGTTRHEHDLWSFMAKSTSFSYAVCFQRLVAPMLRISPLPGRHGGRRTSSPCPAFLLWSGFQLPGHLQGWGRVETHRRADDLSSQCSPSEETGIPNNPHATPSISRLTSMSGPNPLCPRRSSGPTQCLCRAPRPTIWSQRRLECFDHPGMGFGIRYTGPSSHEIRICLSPSASSVGLLTRVTVC